MNKGDAERLESIRARRAAIESRRKKPWVASGNGVHEGISAVAITCDPKSASLAEFFGNAPSDIDFLLSLLDSPANEVEQGHMKSKVETGEYDRW